MLMLILALFWVADHRLLVSSHGLGALSVQFCLSVVSDSVTPWAAVFQASLSSTNSRSLIKLMSIQSVMPSSHLSILGTYRPGEFILQCHVFSPFHTVHGILMARILKWFAIPFSRGPHFVRTLHHDLSILGGPTRHGWWFHWVGQGCGLCDKFG